MYWQRLGSDCHKLASAQLPLKLIQLTPQRMTHLTSTAKIGGGGGGGAVSRYYVITLSVN